ncbi:MAG: DUF2550 domain-containing protein [Mycobacteriales bacterium]
MIATAAAETLAVLSLLVVLALAALFARRRALARGGGTVEVSFRLRDASTGGGWVLGLGRFHGDLLQWYRVFSLAMRPRRTFTRRELTVVAQRQPVAAETRALLAGAVVMECRSSGESVELAMGPSAATGFLAWLEAAPPGATLPT